MIKFLRLERTFLCLAVLLSFVPAALALEPAGWRVNGLVAPLGLDEAPVFSWQLRVREGERGARQTAWEVRVGNAPEKSDAWDSGRVKSAEQLGVAYAGRALRSHEKLYWQVRVWDEQKRVSAWSPPAEFTVGVLTKSDWTPAAWITDPELLRWRRDQLGFATPERTDPNTEEWVQLDLGATAPIDFVRFYSVRHTVVENTGFPERYKVEVADEPEFRSPRMLVDHTAEGAGRAWGVIEIDAQGQAARYLRLTAPRLHVEEGRARLAFSQIEVRSKGKNIAAAAAVTASARVEDNQWSAASGVDGLGIPGANPRANATLRLRREFTVRPGLRRALLHVSGLGHYALQINGTSFDAGRLTPGWANYDRTAFYDTHDLTSLLRAGKNAAGIELASGMYNVQAGRYTKFVSPFRPLMAIALLRLEYADGSIDTIATDSAWRVAPGPVTFSHVYGGEDYDARLETTGWAGAGFDDHSWTAAVTTQNPATLRGISRASPPFRTFQTLTPVAIRDLSAGVTVYDLGQNTALMLHLQVRGEPGARVKIIPAELVFPDGSIDRRSSSPGGEAAWNYTLSGRDSEEWRPEFFYHGARYLQVETTPAPESGELPAIELIEGTVVHSDSPPAGDFACSDDLFNRIRQLVRWAQASNLAHVITDCPHRERLGWLEQYHLNGPALRYEWDLAQLYRKCFDDMADAQTAEGLVPDIAPEYVKFSGGFRDSPEWGSAFILAAWQQYVWAGDSTPLRRHYDAMHRYLDYLAGKATGQILNHGLGDWYDLGPNPPGVAQLTPIALTATAIYYEDTLTLARVATLLGRDKDARELSGRAAEIKSAFNLKFLQVETGVYATGSQTAQSMALVLGMVPEERRAAALDVLVRDVQSRGNSITAGDVGYRYLLRALADGGRSDVIYAMNHQSEKPGYGYQLEHGATSLTEAWDARPESSQNHFMLGQITEWFYGDLAGLNPDPAAPGFGHLIIRPQPVAGIDWAHVRYESVRGPIAVAWQRAKGTFSLHVEIPPGCTATVFLPAPAYSPLREGTMTLEKSSAVKLVRREASAAVIEVPSGVYDFSAVEN